MQSQVVKGRSGWSARSLLALLSTQALKLQRPNAFTSVAASAGGSPSLRRGCSSLPCR